MARASVRYYGLIRPLVGSRKQDDVSIREGTTLRDILNFLGDRYGNRFTNKLINEEGFLIAGSVVIAVDGMRVSDLNLDVPISDGSTVELSLSY